MKRRGHSRININSPESLVDVMNDMFHEFLEQLIEKDWATEWADEEEGEHNFMWIYTQRGMQIIEKYIERMGNLFEKIFPESNVFELKSSLFIEQ